MLQSVLHTICTLNSTEILLSALQLVQGGPFVLPLVGLTFLYNTFYLLEVMDIFSLVTIFK